jgi:hypothetical protein
LCRFIILDDVYLSDSFFRWNFFQVFVLLAGIFYIEETKGLVTSAEGNFVEVVLFMLFGILCLSTVLVVRYLPRLTYRQEKIYYDTNELPRIASFDAAAHIAVSRPIAPLSTMQTVQRDFRPK